MNYAKGHLFARTRVEFSFRALVDRTIRELRTGVYFAAHH